MRKFFRGDIFFQWVVNIVMIVFLLLMAYPLIYIISCSFSDPGAVNSGKVVLFPVGFTFEGYQKVFERTEIWVGYGNTIFYTVVGTLINLAITIPAAFALSRKELKGKGVIMIYFMITMYISGGLIPSYLNIKSFGLLNSRVLMVILGALSIYNMIVARTFFSSSIPYEITEAARIDGCDDFSILSRIVMPLSKSITVVLILYYGIGHWNSYFNAMIYLKDRDKFPLQMFLREILLMGQLEQESLANQAYMTAEEARALAEQARAADLIKYCVIIVSSLPMMIIYPKLQKYFEKGVMIGSVKG